ncbi:MAG: hypothetical protein H6659_05540 [Ardenticatenaceae bacterium]|nr:hypothetical protein [Ardenticatenaceae bacterium]
MFTLFCPDGCSILPDLARFRTFLLVLSVSRSSLPNRQANLVYALDVSGFGMKWGERTVIRPPHFHLWKVFLDGYCYILCADGYTEKAVQETKLVLASMGLAAAFLGLKVGRIRGAAGGHIFPEVLISQVTGEERERPLPDGLLLAGGAVCGQYLLADPRVQSLTWHMLATARPVGLLHPVCYPLADLLEKRLNSFLLIQPEIQTTADFVNAFVQRLTESRQAGQTPALNNF